MADILRIGTRSILAYQAALSVTAQNIANASTPFYSRRKIDFSEAIYNNGVNLSDVRRVFDENASHNLSKANSDQVKSDIYLNALKNLETLFGDTVSTDPNHADGNGIGKYINEAISSLNQLNTNVSSIQSRGLYLAKLDNMASRFNQISSQTKLQNNNINSALQVDATKINVITKQISEINKQFASSLSTDKAALLDQRESLLHDLSGLINFNVATLDDGQINITLKNGTPLVFGMEKFDIVVMPDDVNPANQTLTLQVGNGYVNVNQAFSGGEVGGLIAFRNDLAQTERSLDRLSLVMSQSLNQQNSLGIDINGNLGSNIFRDVNEEKLVTQRVISNANNTGTGDFRVNITNCSQLTDSDYQLKFDTNNHYNLTRISDGSVVTSGTINAYPATIAADGFSVEVSSGTFTAGDSFIVSPTKNAANNMGVAITDPGLLALGLPVAVSPAMGNSGSGALIVSGITDTSNSAFSTPLQLDPPLRLEFLDSGHYQIVNANNSSVIEGPLVYDPVNGTSVFPTAGGYDPGYRIVLSGDIKAGDAFNVAYNTNGSGDNRNGQLLADTYNKGILDNGKFNFNQAYNSITTDVAVKTNSAQLVYESANIVNAQAESFYESISGVSIEEEKVNLAQYQQAYQASAEIIEAARTIFETIISLSRG